MDQPQHDESNESAPEPMDDQAEALHAAPEEGSEESVAAEPAAAEADAVEAAAAEASEEAQDGSAAEEPAPAAEPAAAQGPAPADEEDDEEGDEVADEPAAAEAEEAPSVPVVVAPELEAAIEEAFAGAPASFDEPAETPAAPAAVVAEAAEAAEGEATDEEEEEKPLVEWVPGDWYVVHTYAGYENKVQADLKTRVASMNMEDKIYEVVIPMEEVMEIKGGKKQMVQRKVFPGYLLVRMDLDDDSWYVVRNTPGVTGFVGSGTRPIPLSEREVDKILQRKGEAEKPKPKLEWQVNDPVRVTTGPFANFQGVISEVDDERQQIKVLVNIFGRETPVTLSYDQVSKV